MLLLVMLALLSGRAIAAGGDSVPAASSKDPVECCGEARSILIRDSNKVVCSAVVNNPRITEQEIENIAAMRTVSDEVLRLIAMNRSWARSYPIIHNLARNPRTPIPTAMNILNRIRTKDLVNLSQNRNVSETVRRQAYRLQQVRSGE